MVKYQVDSLSTTFAALSDPTRRAVLARLGTGEATVGELAAPFAMSLPAVSKHLKVLEVAGLLVRRKDGRVHRCGVNPQPLVEAAAWIEQQRQFWEDRLDSLERYLRDTTPKPDTDKEEDHGHC